MHLLSTTRIQLSRNLRSRRSTLSSNPLSIALTAESRGFRCLVRCGNCLNPKGQGLFRLDRRRRCVGGADRDRTDDPLLAKQVLSQLSYSPGSVRLAGLKIEGPDRRMLYRSRQSQLSINSLVGLGRFELPTSRLSGVRSNQLSYRPRLRRSAASSLQPPAAAIRLS